MLRYLFIRFITPTIWKYNPKQQALTLKRFAATEKDSGVQLLSSIKYFKSSHIRAFVLDQSLDEFHHSDLFIKVLKSIYPHHLTSSYQCRNNIINEVHQQPAQLKQFIAQIHIGETQINKQFSWYKSPILNKKISSLFEIISKDEQGHSTDTLKILKEMTGENIFQFKKIILIARFVQFKKQIEDYFSTLSSILLFIALALIYFIIGGLTFFFTKNDKDQFENDQLLLIQK